MKSKICSCLLAILAVVGAATAQEKEIKKAGRLFDQFQYASAAILYEQALAKDPSNTAAVHRLIDCYLKVNDTRRSERWLSSVCEEENVDPIYLKLYGQVLASNKKYKESSDYYKKYSTRTSDSSVVKMIAGLENLNRFYEDSTFYVVSGLKFNSPEADFSPAFFEDGIVFCSSRKTGKKQTSYSWDHSAFIDLYYASFKTGSVIPFAKPVNSPLHEGPATFSANGDTIYFTRNNHTGNRTLASKNGIVKLKLYYSVKTEQGWQKEREFPFNSNEYSTGHPASGKNGRLYFVSDMPGGFGGTDIYYSEFRNGTWNEPTNAGPAINSSGNEMFPFVDGFGTLYFASNGHSGLGGLDMFKSVLVGGSFSSPMNLGYPLNSSKDDFGMIIVGEKGFFSSNRGVNHLDDNIYSFEIRKSRRLRVQATNGEEPLQNYTVEVMRDGVSSGPADVAQLFSGEFHADCYYELVITKAGYKTQRMVVDKSLLAGVADGEALKVELARLPKRLNVVLLTHDNKRLALGNIEVKNLATGATVIFDSGKEGVSGIEFDQNTDYELTGSKVNFMKNVVTLPASRIQTMEEDQQLVITLQVPVGLFEKNEIGQMIEMDIKYDLAKFNIRKDAAKELDRLVDYMKKNSSIKVELGSHTDARGSTSANHILSQKRAASAARYLVNKGIRSERIIPVGYGEEDLKIKEATTEDQHQQNRRTTVKIVGI